MYVQTEKTSDVVIGAKSSAGTYPIRIASIAALGGFLFGFEVSVISGAEKTIQQLWSLSAGWLGFTVASSLIGTVLGSLIVGSPVQKFGRKKVLTTIALMYVLASIGCGLAQYWSLFILFRFIGGIAVGASSVVGPMYIAEIAPPAQRGRLAGLFQLNIVAGILVAYFTNYMLSGMGETSWRWMMGIMAVPSVLFALLVRTIPESPRWLVLNNRDEEARKVFSKLGESDTTELIKEEHRLSASGNKERLMSAKYRKPVFYAVLLALFNQLSGINAIIYYAPRIFEMAGFNKADAFQQSVFIGLANFIFTIIAMTVIDKFGRKKLLLTGAAGMFVCLSLAAFSFYQPDQNSHFVIYCLVGFIAFFAFSQGAVIWVFISEIFPNAVRSQGASLGSFAHWIMAAIISWTFPIVVESNPMGGFYSFVFYGVMMLLSFLFIWKVMPETKGKSLEEIEKGLSNES